MIGMQKSQVARYVFAPNHSLAFFFNLSLFTPVGGIIGKMIKW
jgi:hypothetical protein